MEINIENMTKRKEFEELKNKCKEFVPYKVFVDLSNDIGSLVSKSDFMAQAADIDNIRKHVQGVMGKEESI